MKSVLLESTKLLIRNWEHELFFGVLTGLEYVFSSNCSVLLRLDIVMVFFRDKASSISFFLSKDPFLSYSLLFSMLLKSDSISPDLKSTSFLSGILAYFSKVLNYSLENVEAWRFYLSRMFLGYFSWINLFISSIFWPLNFAFIFFFAAY